MGIGFGVARVSSQLPPNSDAASGFAAECDFGAIDAEDARVASGSRVSAGDGGSGDEAKLHQAGREILGEVDSFEHAFFAVCEIGEGAVRCGEGPFATELHLGFSMERFPEACQALLLQVTCRNGSKSPSLSMNPDSWNWSRA